MLRIASPRGVLPHHLLELILAFSTSSANARPYVVKHPPVAPDVEPSTSADMLSRLSAALASEKKGTLTVTEAESHNHRLSILRLALGSKDLLRVRDAFEDLKKHSSTEALMARDFEVISRMLQKHFSESGRAQDTIVGASDMAIQAAAHGHTFGLKACLLLHFRSGEFQDVSSQYAKFSAIALRNLTSPIERPVSPCQTDTGSEATHVLEFMDHKPMVIPGVADLVLIVIAAHAVEDRFDLAFDHFLATPMTVRVPTPRVNAFCDVYLIHNPRLAEKVRNWTEELVLLRLVSRQSSLKNYVTGLANNKNIAPLQKLYSTIISECRKADGRFVVRPEVMPLTSVGGEERRSIVVSNDTWSIFIHAFFRCHRADLVENLWSDVVGIGLSPNRHLWTALLDGYGQHGNCDKARSVWNRMLEEGIEPNEVSYGAMTYAYFFARRPHEGLSLFEQFRLRLGTTMQGKRSLRDPTMLPLYNIVLHGLCTNAIDDRARSLMKEMTHLGPKPDIVSYNIFLRHYGRVGDMKSLAAVLRSLHPAGVKPDAHSFTTVLSALYKAGKRDAHTKTILIMKTMGVQPNVAMYSAIIDFLVRQGGEENFRNAGSLLHMMENNPDKESRPNEVTYTGLLAGLHRDHTIPVEAVKTYTADLFARMHKNGTLPNRTTYHYLIKACLENPDAHGLQMALGYYREMEKRSFTLTNRTWYVMLSALLRRGDVAIASEVMGEMFRKGHKPDNSLATLVGRIRRATALNNPPGYV